MTLRNLVLASLIITQACKPAGTNPGTGPGTTTATAGPGSVSGLVMDLGTGVGVADASVSAGGKTATTDSRGYFTISGLATGVVTVSVNKKGFAPGYATPKVGDQTASTLVSLKKEGAPQAYTPSMDKTLSLKTEAGPYAVSFVANSLDTTDTNLTVSITPVDPSKEASVLPGNLVTTSSSVLFPVTFAEFSILDGSGKRVQLKSGQSATVELPIPPTMRDQYAIGAKIHCYAFNTDTGAWDDFVDGTVRASSVDGSTPVLAAAIKHFSWYGGAPEGSNCFDVVGQVVTADGKGLGFAQVEASPGASAVTDADGFFTVLASGSSTKFFAYFTAIDTDGTITDIKGQSYIKFGEVTESLTDLTLKPCTTTAAAASSPAGKKGADKTTPVKVSVGGIGKLAYVVNAFVLGGSTQAIVTVQSGLPGSDGSLMNEMPVSGSKITISSGATSQLMAEVFAGSGEYAFPSDSTFAFEKGKTYQIAIDADANGSIDGQGTFSVVGDLALTKPVTGMTYAAAGFAPTWTDTGIALGGPSYTALYMVSIAGSSSSGTAAGYSYYIGSDLTFTATNLFSLLTTTTTAPLPAGDYTITLTGFSGWAAAAGSNFVQSNNITGVGLTGTAYSVSQSATATFTLQ